MTRNRRLLSILLATLALVAAGLGGHALLREQALSAGPATVAQTLRITPGSSLRSALQQLQQQGLIRSARLLELWLRCCDAPSRQRLPDIHAGRYLIEPGQPALVVLEQLVSGRVVLEQFTLIEGWNLRQLREALAQHPAITRRSADVPADQLLQSLGLGSGPAEGRFAPDTYRFEENTPDSQVLKMAFAAQQQRLARAWQDRDPELPLASPEQLLVLASLVEKETGMASERPMIAGVFVNRLRRNMRLQSDPTVIYGLFERYDGNIRKRDLQSDTPWNTYTRDGLPPTPIAMPGDAALRASARPQSTPALYFVARGDGSGAHEFTATLEQHNQAVARYLARLRQGER